MTETKFDRHIFKGALVNLVTRPDNRGKAGGGTFVSVDFSSWKKKGKLQTHVGGHNSAHNQAWSKCLDLLGQKQLIQEISPKQSDHAQNEFRTFLKASIDSIWYVLRQKFLSCDPDEYLFDVSNEGLFLELLKFAADKNEHIKAVLALDDAPQNLELASADLRKDIVSVAAFETIGEIIRDLGDGPFSIWIDETHDVSKEDQMIVVLRYVDRKGQVIERFLGIGHVKSTGAFSRKIAVEWTKYF
ncbi:hypothetical protein RHMOL_Rhmol07G0254500 [Rhododendron molle]|uniref:Uncharacterized protein n=1 Tax=Rhododendron molle TaxID=49168 RepID=A0ACC0N4V3_RHOML|nr:hypothetical protein RHMOL_Rhmol07G0254500 [Rhododendron molle]